MNLLHNFDLYELSYNVYSCPNMYYSGETFIIGLNYIVLYLVFGSLFLNFDSIRGTIGLIEDEVHFSSSIKFLLNLVFQPTNGFID